MIKSCPNHLEKQVEVIELSTLQTRVYYLNTKVVDTTLVVSCRNTLGLIFYDNGIT